MGLKEHGVIEYPENPGSGYAREHALGVGQCWMHPTAQEQGSAREALVSQAVGRPSTVSPAREGLPLQLQGGEHRKWFVHLKHHVAPGKEQGKSWKCTFK